MYLDPNWVHNQQLCGSGSVFRIRIHTGKNRINKVVRSKKKIRDPDKNSIYLDWIHNTADAKIQLSGWALASGLWPRGAI